MTQHSTAPLNADNVHFEENIRFRGKSTDQGAEFSDSAWEDEDIVLDRPNNGDPRRPSSPAGSGASTRQTPKHSKRRKATNRRNDRTQAPNPPRHEKESYTFPSADALLDGAKEISILTIRYFWDVSSRAFHHSRYMLGFLLALWMVALITLQVSPTLWGAVSPVCYLPFISSSELCKTWRDAMPGKQAPQWADYPKMVDLQSKTFEQLMDESIGGSALSLEVKKAEMTISDLISFVRLSKLKAKDSLANTLIDFVLDAKKAGRGLQKLSSKFGGMVDRIMAVNDYALQKIDAAQIKPSPFYAALAPWTRKSRKKITDKVVAETFGEAMDILSIDMERLIIEAEANIIALDTLEERLSTLHDIISREDLTLSSEKADLLAELWTILGLRRTDLRNFDQSLSLLKELKTYRQQALGRVVTALQTLQIMSADMEDLRERVAKPSIAGSAIPVEVHMKSIQFGLERLREGRIRSKELDEAAIRRVLSMNDIDIDED
jgi:hypothetical protein